MSKYIIDTDEWANLFDVQTVGIFGIGEDWITGDKTVYSRTFHIDDFPKLTDGYVNEHFYHLLEEAFQIGLDHAWEAARKIACTPQEEGLGRKMLDAVFGDALDRSEIMFTYSAQEAIDKIKAYEDEQKEKDPIKVGDKVILSSDSHVGKVLSIVNGICYIMWEDKTVSGYGISGVRRCTE